MSPGRWTRIGARALAAVALAAAVFHYRGELAAALAQALDAGWTVLWVFPLFLMWNVVAALAWRSIIKGVAASGGPGVGRLTLIRIEAQAVNNLLPLASIPGEVLRATLLAAARASAAWHAAASVALDTVSATMAGLLFTLAGLGAHWALAPVGGGAIIALGAMLVGLALAIALLPAAAARLSRTRWIGSLRPALLEIGRDAPARRRAVRHAVLWHLLERTLTAAELCILARAIGVDLDLRGVLFAGAMMTGFSLLFWFIPAQIGAIEGALVLAFSALGAAPGTGLSVALIRRGRQLATALGGLLLLLVYERAGRSLLRPGGARARSGPEQPAAADRDERRGSEDVVDVEVDSDRIGVR